MLSASLFVVPLVEIERVLFLVDVRDCVVCRGRVSTSDGRWCGV